MQVEYKRTACNGWFQCVQKWDAFEMNMPEGKADLPDAEEVSDGVFVVEVGDDEESDVRAAAESCPVDAIVLYDESGEQVFPE